jgi:hypothetical protein
LRLSGKSLNEEIDCVRKSHSCYENFSNASWL